MAKKFTALQRAKASIKRLAERQGKQYATTTVRASPQYKSIVTRYKNAAAKEGKEPSKKIAAALQPTARQYEKQQLDNVREKLGVKKLSSRTRESPEYKRASNRIRQVRVREQNIKLEKGLQKEPPPSSWKITTIASQLPFFQVLSYNNIDKDGVLTSNAREAWQQYELQKSSPQAAKGVNPKRVVLTIERPTTKPDQNGEYETEIQTYEGDYNIDKAMKELFNELQNQMQGQSRPTGATRSFTTDEAAQVDIIQAINNNVISTFIRVYPDFEI